MAKKQLSLFPEPAKPPVAEQVSSGGVAFKKAAAGIEVALIAVGANRRWQLPKGLVDAGETPEKTALREVREEAGIETELVEKIDTITYWYVGKQGPKTVRFHKLVHFFLLRYTSGNVADHDHEVQEARWVPLQQARQMLAFKGEQQVLAKAAKLLEALEG